MIDELDTAIAALGLHLQTPGDLQRIEAHDVQIWSDGSITCRVGSATVSAKDKDLESRQPVRAVEESGRLTSPLQWTRPLLRFSLNVKSCVFGALPLTGRVRHQNKSDVRSSISWRSLMPTSQQIIHSDPETLGGTPVFVGTRVPVQTLLDYLAEGASLDEFLDHFPTVTREQAEIGRASCRERV